MMSGKHEREKMEIKNGQRKTNFLTYSSFHAERVAESSLSKRDGKFHQVGERRVGLLLSLLTRLS